MPDDEFDGSASIKETLGALRVRVYNCERALERMDERGSRGLVSLQTQVEDMRRSLEGVGSSEVHSKLAVLDERSKTITEVQSKMVEQMDQIRGRITAFAWTIAGGAVLFAVSTIIQVLGK